MSNKRDPILEPVPILSLRPTQLTVGMREVKEKRRRWREHKPKKRAELLGRHMIPVIKGRNERNYVIDHHHLALALHEEGVEHVLVTVIADLSMVEASWFWNVMDARHWAHPYDARGIRRLHSDLPDNVTDLVDDPYRSLAGELRRAGGFAKDTTPFSEFMWADFLRKRVSPKLIKRDFDQALERALKFGRGDEAVYLPGWCGPVTDD
jgi:hypothetical protein